MGPEDQLDTGAECSLLCSGLDRYAGLVANVDGTEAELPRATSNSLPYQSAS